MSLVAGIIKIFQILGPILLKSQPNLYFSTRILTFNALLVIIHCCDILSQYSSPHIRRIVMPVNPKGFLRGMKRADRKMARAIRNNAAASFGVGRFEFMAAVVDGDVEAINELKMSILEQDGSLELDIERLQEILDMVLDFIKALMAIFSGFGWM